MIDFSESLYRIAKEAPNTTAIIDDDSKISYDCLVKLVNAIANHFLHIKPNIKIILDLPQGKDAYAIILGALIAGGVYCPFNREAPADRKKQIISQFMPDLIISSESNESGGYGDIPVISPNTIGNGFVDERPSYSAYDPESIVYVIYTSGSTGEPKGVQVCRKALNKFLEWSVPAFGAVKGDIWGQFSALSFDLSIVDIFTCLCSGATLLTIGSMADKIRPTEVIRISGINIWHSIPSAIEFMLRSEKSRPADLKSIKLMSFCGEPLRKHHCDFLFEKNPDMTIFNTYGPTEGTLFCTWQPLKLSDYNNFYDHTMSIGQAIPGWNLLLVDAEEYEEKEVVIYGKYIGKGYIGDVPHAKFNKIMIGDTEEESFETGDLVYLKKDHLYFASRKDRQVKLKGYRIEPDEIDFWIQYFLKKPSVTILYEQALYTFIETAEAIDESVLRADLANKIEQYKVPRKFIAINKLPRNTNLKVDLKQLLSRLNAK